MRIRARYGLSMWEIRSARSNSATCEIRSLSICLTQRPARSGARADLEHVIPEVAMAKVAERKRHGVVREEHPPAIGGQ